MNTDQQTKCYLDLAARVASRGFGQVEPNPMVGAVIVKDDQIIGIGHHTKFGWLHAEREAIANARSRGFDPKGATLYCTLEPCSHFGKQPPCTQAVIEAGIAKVIIARKDPAKVSAGGMQVLQEAGVEIVVSTASPNATRLSGPFLHKLETGKPWVIAKWAQTIDGRIATRSGESQWISNAHCRARVHRLRAKVDGIMIGIGTAIADDPLLTARDCRSVRKIAKRIILDTQGQLSLDSKLIQTAGQYETIVCTANPSALSSSECKVIEAPIVDQHIDLHATLTALSDHHGVTNLLVEAGPRVLGSLIEQDLINEAIVHIAPGILGDDQAKAVAAGRETPSLIDMRRFELIRSKHIENDIELHYRRLAQS